MSCMVAGEKGAHRCHRRLKSRVGRLQEYRAIASPSRRARSERETVLEMTRKQMIYIFPYGFKYIKNLCYIDTFLHVEAQAVFCIGSLSRKEGRLLYAGKEGWLLGLEVISRFTAGEWRETTRRPRYCRGRWTTFRSMCCQPSSILRAGGVICALQM